MSKYVKSTTETIIQTLTDAGHTIEYSSNDSGKMCMSVDGEPSQLIADSFEHLNEQFIAHYVNLAQGGGKRIDGACTHKWHTFPIQDITVNCPACREEKPLLRGGLDKECTNIWHQIDARFGDCPTCGEKDECEDEWQKSITYKR